jgi:hypothetical protein
MASRNSDSLIRLGVLALPLAGLLALVGLYSSFQLGTGGILATGDNRAIISGGYYVSQLLGNALALIALGVFAFAVPALSRSFLEGNQESIIISDYIFEGPFRIIVTLALLLYLAGFILWGVAIWRSGVLPKWAGVLVALHAPLLIFGPVSVVGTVVGAVFALVGGGWIALSVLQSSSPAQMQAEPEPRVR